MLTTDHLLRVIDAFREAREVSDARVSALLFNDGKRVRTLRYGGDVGSRPLAAAFQWLSDHWPADGRWPTDVPRPPAAAIEALASARPKVEVAGEFAEPERCFSPHGFSEAVNGGQSR